MLKISLARLHQRHRTMAYPDGPPPPMPERFRGRPIFDTAKCTACTDASTAHSPDASSLAPPISGNAPSASSPPPSALLPPPCAQACPTQAITVNGKPVVDMGRCLFCTDCLDACPEGAVHYSKDYRLSVRQRDDLKVDPATELALAAALDKNLLRLFGRSLKLRVVSAGGCNACEMDVNVLNTVGWDLGRFGIQFVAAPRHADGLLITGAISQNMRLALKKTYDAIPDPKIVIAVGACAISGGPYLDHKQVLNGAEAVVPVDLYIPGCPPHPLTILDGLLRLLGRLEKEGRVGAGAAVPSMAH